MAFGNIISFLHYCFLYLWELKIYADFMFTYVIYLLSQIINTGVLNNYAYRGAIIGRKCENVLHLFSLLNLLQYTKCLTCFCEHYYMHIYMHIFHKYRSCTYIHMYEHVHIYIYIYICVCVHTCVYAHWLSTYLGFVFTMM